MKPCKHLDYEGNYTDCQVKTMAGPSMSDVRYWERGATWRDYPDSPVNVQFCKLRGRINEVFACYNEGEMGCYEVDALDADHEEGSGDEHDE